MEAGAVQQGRRILLVEDEPGLQEALAMVLEYEGYEVVLAADGREGLARLASMRPDLILTDYMMPHMDGGEMMRQIRAHSDYAGIPILLMSAALPSSANIEFADVFLPKPTGVDRLLGAVAELLKLA